jgi:hypothetical protein
MWRWLRKTLPRRQLSLFRMPRGGSRIQVIYRQPQGERESRMGRLQEGLYSCADW